MKTYWLSTPRMTVRVTEEGVVVDAAPIVQRFVGQPLANLTAWMRKQGGFQAALLNAPEITSVESSPAGNEHQPRKEPAMAFQQRENSGALFSNRDKTDERQPNSKGTALIGGKRYWVSGWTKNSEKAGKWISLSFKEIDESAQTGDDGEGQANDPGF